MTVAIGDIVTIDHTAPRAQGEWKVIKINPKTFGLENDNGKRCKASKEMVLPVGTVAPKAPTYREGDHVVFIEPRRREVGTWEVVKINRQTVNIDPVGFEAAPLRVHPSLLMLAVDVPVETATKTPVKKKKAPAKTPVKKTRPAGMKKVAAKKPEAKKEMTTAYGAKAGDIVTLSDSGSKRWLIVKVTAKELWVDAVRGDDQYTISHDLVTKIVKSA